MRTRSILLIIFCIALVACGKKPVPPGWTQVNTKTSPPALSQSAVAFNTKSAQGVLFGGISASGLSDATWIWDGSKWFNPTPDRYPAARQMASMAYDPSRSRVVLFGGLHNEISLGDTWEWDGYQWRPMSPAHHPRHRCCHAMAYDPASQRILLYGGWSSVTGEFYSDTWAWDGVDWVNLTCCDTPPAARHAMVDFPPYNEVLSQHSQDPYGTWVWDGALWHGLRMAHPPARQDPRLVYDSKNQRAVLFGGMRGDQNLNDTWVFDGSAWIMVDSPNPPAARFGHAMFYDPERGVIILFGGEDETGLLGDTWQLNLPGDL